MNAKELSEKITQLKELKHFAEDIETEIAALTTSIKEHMDVQQLDTLKGDDWKVTYKPVTTARIDTTSLKRDMPDVAKQYTKTTTIKRFVVV